MAHQAHGAGVDHLIELVQVEQASFGLVLKVRVHVGDELVLLLFDVAEVDEEAAAHVLLERVHLARVTHRLVAFDQQIAVLEQAAAAYLFGRLGRYELHVEVVDGLVEIAVHGLGVDARVRVLAHRPAVQARVVEGEQRGQIDLEAVDAELKLTLHLVHELELHVLTELIEERDEGPA